MSTEIVRAAEALVAVCEEAFEQHFIFDHEVRLAVCTRLLESGELIDQIGSGYDLLSLVNGDMVKTVDPYKSSRTSVTVSVGLTAQERAELVAANPDVDLVFKDGMTMPHAKANALRSIHRKKALSLVAHHRGTVLDIGGNYLQAALGAGSRNYNIHNCTLLAGETEHHRQVQRDVAIEVSSLDAPDYCTAGAENCTVQASQGVCIHALTCIDPGLWPEIFQRHGLEYVVCYFHYDPAMEVDDVGFMPVPGMHWVRKGDIIECHFDNDSSHPYIHNREWMLRYGSSWTATLPDWDYLVYYEVEHLKDGVAKASFTRMDKRTLGPEDDMCQYRLLDLDDCVDLDVPEFDPTLGRSIKDPRAYTISTVRVTLPLFSHVYRLGISNDTSRPDLPLTFDAIRDQCHAFNHVRRVNGTSLTVPYRLGSDVIDSVALGMYLLIVHRAAVARAQYSAYTDSMRRLQQCWGDESVAKLVVKAASYAVVAPYVMLAESFEQSVDIAVVCMRNYVVNSGHTVDAVVPARYRLLSPIRTMESTAQRILTVDSVLPDTTVLPDVVSAQRFLTMFENTLTPAQREAVQHQIDLDEKPEPVNVTLETPQQGDEDEQHSREEWDEEYAELQERLDAMTLPPINDAAYTFAERTNHDKVWEFFKESIMEYRAYNIDVGLHTIKNAVELCQATWAGEPIKSKIHERNVSADVGIKYIDCKDGVLDISPDESYACVIDPGTLKYYMTTIRGGVVTVPIRTVEKVFTMATLRIFNAFAIAKEAKKMLELDYVPKCTAELVDGVPGCGKTYNILQEFTEHDVILTAVKDTRDATLAELLAMDKFKGMDELLKKRVRTIDSADLHSVPRARTMFADEGLMAHMGGVCMGMVRCRPKRLKAYGDSTQIRFIDRGSRLGNMHFQSLFYWTAISELNTTVRCPADAIWVSSRFYPAERRPRIKTISPVRRSIEFVLEPNPKSPVWSNVDAAWSVLSILRGDGADLVARDTKFSFGSASRADGREGAVKVYSVHEIQGRTRPLVRAVRMTPFNPDVVKSPPHMNVMFTRHTLKMQYVSCKGPADDECSRLAVAAQRLTNEELDEFILPCPEWLQKRTMERQQQYAAYL